MTLSTGYLTPKQKIIWDLKNKGSIEANIARKLNVTRQTVHKVLNVAYDKVSEALLETANLNKIKVKKFDPAKGILLGYSTEFKTQTLVTFSAKNGVQIWYKHEGNCKTCDRLQSCKKILLTEMEERNIQPPENLDSTLPSKLAELLFSKVIGE
jgi:transcriptional regulator